MPSVNQIKDLMEEIKACISYVTNIHVFVNKLKKEFPDYITEKDSKKLKDNMGESTLILERIQSKIVEYFKRP